MIRRSVALDTQEIPTRPVWIGNRQVNKETSDTYLWMNLIPTFLKGIRDLNFKHTVMIAPCCTRHREAIALYSSPPGKVRIEIRDEQSRPEVVIVSNGNEVAEFHPRKHEYIPLAGAAIEVSFSPEKGIGFGEMLYDTIAEGVAKARIRGWQTLHVGSDELRCAVIDVEYRRSSDQAQFSFWISEDKALVLRRAVTFIDEHGEVKTMVSSVQALTLDEVVPDAVFDPRPGTDTKRVPLDEIF